MIPMMENQTGRKMESDMDNWYCTVVDRDQGFMKLGIPFFVAFIMGNMLP